MRSLYPLCCVSCIFFIQATSLFKPKDNAVWQWRPAGISHEYSYIADCLSRHPKNPCRFYKQGAISYWDYRAILQGVFQVIPGKLH